MKTPDINLNEVLLVATLPFALFFQTWPVAILALGALLNYGVWRWQANEIGKATEQDRRISNIQFHIDRLTTDMRSLLAEYQDVKRQSEDVKKIVQQHNLKQMFGPKV